MPLRNFSMPAHSLSRYHRISGLSPTGTFARASLTGPKASSSRSFSITWQRMPGAADSTTRFSSRVADYVSSRPSYPPEVVSLLSSQFNLPQNATIVDIGSGTGISSRLLLERLKEKEVNVVGVEPNKEMRLAGDELLADYTDSGAFSSRDGTAEDTGLPDDSVDLVVAAQAFHWFNVPKAREECQRILKKSGTSGVALIWNERLGVEPSTEGSGKFPQLDNPVMSAYDLLLVRRAKDYEEVSHHKTVDEDVLKAFFGPEGFKVSKFSNPYRLDFEQLKGRLLSSSYTPQEGDDGYDAMMKELKDLFEKYQNGGKIDFLYDTNVFYGPLS